MRVGRNTGSPKSVSEHKSFIYTEAMHNDGLVGFEKILENINMRRLDEEVAWEINMEC